jgi:hypothetical protein
VRTSASLLALGLILALAFPAAVIAQSAGDEQYVDPFQQGPSGGNGGNQGGGGGDAGSQGGSGGDQGGSTTTTPPSTGDGTAGAVASDPGTDTTSGGNGEALPSTGLALGGPALTGVLLLAGGIALRRRA